MPADHNDLDDFHRLLVDRYGADPKAYIDAPLGWRTLVENVFEMLYEGNAAATAGIFHVKEKFGQLRIHLHYHGPQAERFHKYVAAVEERALRTCDRCGASGRMRDEWPIRHLEVICDPCLRNARIRDQLDRRRTELLSAVRDWCDKLARTGLWLEASEYAQRLWLKDGEDKRETMRQPFRIVIHELDLLSVGHRPQQVADFEPYKDLVGKIDINEILERLV